MPESLLPRVVIDTNVVFEGLTKQGSASGLIIDAWISGVIQVCVSNAMICEYEDVLSRKLSLTRWQSLQPVVDSLLSQAEWIVIYYSWRPTSPDPGDDLIIDCAMNANATIVTSNVRDFQRAVQFFGLQVLTPAEFVIQLVS